MSFEFNPFTGQLDRTRGTSNSLCFGGGQACFTWNGVDTLTLTINGVVAQTWTIALGQLLTESGIGLTTETGDPLITEDGIPPPDDLMLTEDGDFLTGEDGIRIANE